MTKKLRKIPIFKKTREKRQKKTRKTKRLVRRMRGVHYNTVTYKKKHVGGKDKPVKIYKNGVYKEPGVYEGDLKDDKRDGKGKMTYLNGNVYEGNWKDDKRDGTGIMIYANDDVYEGDWKDGKRNGNGKMTYEIYKSKLVAPDIQGEEQQVDTYKVLDGKWEDDTFIEGTSILTDGSIYRGEFGKLVDIVDTSKDTDKVSQAIFFNGKGKMTYANGDVYEGDWKNGNPDTTKQIRFNFTIQIGSEKHKLLCAGNITTGAKIKIFKNSTATPPTATPLTATPPTATSPTATSPVKYSKDKDIYIYNSTNHSLDKLDVGNTQIETENLLHAIEEVLYNAGIIQTTAKIQLIEDVDKEIKTTDSDP
jgi:hypothetical protein